MEKLKPMINMAITPKEAEETSSLASAPRYPWGLCLRLTNDEIDKLGVDIADWGVGDTFHLFCLAKVTSISMNEREGVEDCCAVELQIVEMAGESEDEENEEEEKEERRMPTIRYKKG